MIKRFSDLVHVVLYGNIWIACCALAMVWQTGLLSGLPPSLGDYPAGIFFGTLCLYTLHRIISAGRISQDVLAVGRFSLIRRYRLFNGALAAISGVASSICFFRFEGSLQLLLIAPIVVTGLYALPLLPGNRRLRDLPYFKVFLIAVVWGWVTGFIPCFQARGEVSLTVWMLFVERSLFIFGITIPFDIRDIYIDKKMGVNTVPSLIGQSRARKLAASAIGLAGIATMVNPLYDGAQLTSYLMSLLPVLALIKYSTPERSDLYYTVLLDGMMLLQFGMLCLVT